MWRVPLPRRLPSSTGAVVARRVAEPAAGRRSRGVGIATFPRYTIAPLLGATALPARPTRVAGAAASAPPAATTTHTSAATATLSAWRRVIRPELVTAGRQSTQTNSRSRSHINEDQLARPDARRTSNSGDLKKERPRQTEPRPGHAKTPNSIRREESADPAAGPSRPPQHSNIRPRESHNGTGCG